MSKAKEAAKTLLSVAKDYGWSVEVRGSILTIRKVISTNEDFVRADSEYYGILSYLPSTSAGSIWGTDGGGIGALSAMKSGIFTMNKSGGSKLVLKEISKQL